MSRDYDEDGKRLHQLRVRSGSDYRDRQGRKRVSSRTQNHVLPLGRDDPCFPVRTYLVDPVNAAVFQMRGFDSGAVDRDELGQPDDGTEKRLACPGSGQAPRTTVDVETLVANEP